MPSATQTPQHRLADLLLGDAGPLEDFVRSRRAQGMAWRRIERDLLDATNREIDLTYETLRSWFPDAPPAPAHSTEVA